MNWKSCIGFGIVGAIFTTALMHKIIWSCMTCTAADLDQPWEITPFMRIIMVFISLLPTLLCLIVVPPVIKIFIATTEKAENFIIGKH